MNTSTKSPSSPRGPAPEALERMLAAGRDGALLRMSLALAWHRREDEATALAFDPDFTAAHRLQGLIALAIGDNAMAEAAFAKALEVAQRRGSFSW